MKTALQSKKRLLNHGIKPSLHRIAIMEYLMLNKTHPTSDTIFNDLNPKIPTLSKTTVYNTVKLLTERKAILSINIDEKNQRYDSNITQHAHFRCRECGVIYDIMIDKLHVSHSDKTAEKFVITDTEISYKGFCESCNPSD
jgi:Fur family ferric uptake transcriptional regulator/Fur family peroxide stress response transcriptional regulator